MDLRVDQVAEADLDLDLIAALVQEVMGVIRMTEVQMIVVAEAVQTAAQRRRRKRKESNMRLTQTKRKKSLHPSISTHSRVH